MAQDEAPKQDEGWSSCKARRLKLGVAAPSAFCAKGRDVVPIALLEPYDKYLAPQRSEAAAKVGSKIRATSTRPSAESSTTPSS